MLGKVHAGHTSKAMKFYWCMSLDLSYEGHPPVQLRSLKGLKHTMEVG